MHWLEPLHSFLKSGSSWENPAAGNPLDRFKDLISGEADIDAGETVLGVYVNSAHNLDCLVVTDRGIHNVSQRQKFFLSYDSIDSIVEPLSDDRDLDILLKDSEYTSLPVLSSTDDEPDICAFYGFLSALLPWRHKSLTDIKNIKTRAELVTYVSEYALPELAIWLRNDFAEDCIKSLEIDPAIFQHPDIWRLSAFLLIAKPWQDDEC